MAIFRAGLTKLATLLLALTAERTPPSHSPAPNPPRAFDEMRTAHSPSVMAGSIQLLGMAEIKERLGAQWSAVADSAFGIAEQTIRRHLSTEDAYQRHGGETFLLCFASPDKAYAETKTKTIAEEIAALLARQTQDIPLRVEHAVAEVAWVDIDKAERESIADVIARELRQVREKAESSARAWRNELVRTAGVHFRPVWHPPRCVILGYRAMLNELTGANALQHLSSLTTPDELKSTLHELDCLIVGRAIRALDRLLHAGGAAQMIIPVNFNSLSTRATREKYLDLCRDIPQRYRRFLLFEVHGAPTGTPVSRQIEIALALKPCSHGVLVELPNGGQLQELSSVGLFGLSVDARSLPRGAAQATTVLARLVSAANALNLKVFVHGADAVGALEAAKKARADYIDGAAISLPLSEPRTAYRWSPPY